MRLLIGIAVGALAALTIPPSEERTPEPTMERELFLGRLAQIDGLDIGHTQIRITLIGGVVKPHAYKITAGCEDEGGEFPRGPAPDPNPEKGRWKSTSSSTIWPAEMVRSGILEAEYRCPTADPALFARVMAILNERSTLDYRPEDHVEFRSSAGVVRFHFMHPNQID